MNVTTSTPSTAPHANASNRRVGRNYRVWLEQGKEQTLATKVLRSVSAQSVRAKTMMNGGSSASLRRAWADLLIQEVEADTESSARAFDIANAMMGLGQSRARLAGAAEMPRQAAGADKIQACAKFDTCEATKAIFVAMAVRALKGAAGATHLCLHQGYGRENGYRGIHNMVSLKDLTALDMQARAHCDERGASIRISCNSDGAHVDVMSFKRKGGSGPSELYADQMQVALLVRGAIKVGTTLSSTSMVHNTGRAVHERLGIEA